MNSSSLLQGFSGARTLSAWSLLFVPRRPGVYLLSYSDPAHFSIDYVGRSDSDLNARLSRWASEQTRFSSFSFVETRDARGAYDLECRLYHEFEPVENQIHPDSPDGLGLRCPLCGR